MHKKIPRSRPVKKTTEPPSYIHDSSYKGVVITRPTGGNFWVTSYTAKDGRFRAIRETVKKQKAMEMHKAFRLVFL